MRTPGFPARLALLAIRGYQRYLSPIKGYACAFRVATGADSCSRYGYRAIQRRGLGVGLRLLRRRLDMCQLTHVHGQARGRGHHGMLHRQQGYVDAGCDVPGDAACAHEAVDVTGCLNPGCSCGPGDFEWPWSRNRKLGTRDTKELEKLRARIEARKRKDRDDGA